MSVSGVPSVAMLQRRESEAPSLQLLDLGRLLVVPRVLGSYLLDGRGRISYPAVLRHVAIITAYLMEHVLFSNDFGLGLFELVVVVSIQVLDISLLASYMAVLLRRSHFVSFLEKISLDPPRRTVPTWHALATFAPLVAVSVSDLASRLPAFEFTSLVFIHRGLIAGSFVDEFSSFVLLLGYSFDGLNRQLAAARNHEEVRVILVRYDSLCQAAKDLNTVYSVQNLLTMGLSFFMCTTASFRVTREPWLGAALSAGWIVAYASFIGRICLCSYYLTRQTEIFEIQLYEKVKKTPRNTDSIVDVDVLLTDKSIRMTAADYFDLNIETIGGMIAAGTTYVVILMQMIP